MFTSNFEFNSFHSATCLSEVSDFNKDMRSAGQFATSDIAPQDIHHTYMYTVYTDERLKHYEPRQLARFSRQLAFTTTGVMQHDCIYCWYTGINAWLSTWSIVEPHGHWLIPNFKATRQLAAGEDREKYMNKNPQHLHPSALHRHVKRFHPVCVFSARSCHCRYIHVYTCKCLIPLLHTSVLGR